MGAISAQTQVDLQGAYLRAICSASPLLEALAEGKVAKAELLLRTGSEFGANAAAAAAAAAAATVLYCLPLPTSAPRHYHHFPPRDLPPFFGI